MNRFNNMLSLELVARAISTDYGVEVVTDYVKTAMTVCNGTQKTIIIPNLEYDNPDYLNLLRGYIDHEAGHCRFTDFDFVGSAASALEKSLTNIYEDCFVDRNMGKAFIGCGKNLQELAQKFFLRGPGGGHHVEYEDPQQEGYLNLTKKKDILAGVIDYCIITARSVDNTLLRDSAHYVRGFIDKTLPGLTGELDPILQQGGSSQSSEDSGKYAKETMAIILKYIEEKAQQNGRGGKQSAAKLGSAINDMEETGKAVDSLKDALAAAIVKTNAETSAPRPHRTYSMGKDGRTATASMSRLHPVRRNKALKEVSRLDAQLQGLLQTIVMNRGGYTSRGRLDCNRIHRLSVSNPRVFSNRVERIKLNTEVVLCIDMSGSMTLDTRKNTASMGLYALLSSLRKLAGVRSSAVGFAGEQMIDILKPHEPMNDMMMIEPNGGTLCGEALVFAARHFTADPDARRIIFMLTDGESHNEEFFACMVKRFIKAGIELYGFCIDSDGLERFIAKDKYKRIDDIHQLSSAMFAMMRQALLGGNYGKNAAA